MRPTDRASRPGRADPWRNITGCSSTASGSRRPTGYVRGVRPGDRRGDRQRRRRRTRRGRRGPSRRRTGPSGLGGDAHPERAPILHRVQSLHGSPPRRARPPGHSRQREAPRGGAARGHVRPRLPAAGWRRRPGGPTATSCPSPRRRSVCGLLRQPLGVVAAIIAVELPRDDDDARKIAGAGGRLYRRSSSRDLGDAARRHSSDPGSRPRLDLPKGVFNVVTGSRSAPIGNALVERPFVAELAFTGSTEVGKALTARPRRGRSSACRSTRRERYLRRLRRRRPRPTGWRGRWR